MDFMLPLIGPTLQDNSDGAVNIEYAPSSITLYIGSNYSFSTGYIDYKILVPISGNISFDWSYYSYDPINDIPNILVNTTSSNLNGFTPGYSEQSGTMTVSVTAGQTLTIRLTTANEFSWTSLQISNFKYPDVPSTNWSASNGGTIVGSNTGLGVAVSTNGTYTLSNTLNGCTVSDDLDVTFLSVPTAPTVSPSVSYCQNTTATSLTATGDNLKWYVEATGGIVNLTAPTPSTLTVGTTSYWVSQTNVNDCESTRSKIDVTTNGYDEMAQIAMSNQTISMTQSNNGMTYYSNSCQDLITSLMPNGAEPLSGTVMSKVWIETTVPSTFVKRHYEITPALNPNSSTSHVTLYFTQQDFDAYNAANTSKLPANSGDATGKAKLRIEKRSGTSSDGSGSPSTYTGTTTMIDPNDADIVWNATLNRWEVSFDVTSFSGFFAMAAPAVLPIELVSFTGYTEGGSNHLKWTTQSEVNNKGFDIERSLNGRNFTLIGFVNADNNTKSRHEYQFIDANPLSSINYYRLKQLDFDGKISYSSVIALNNAGNESTLIAYPNPVSNVVQLQGKVLESAKGFLMNNLGQTHPIQISGNQFNISHLPQGIYYLSIENHQNLIKIVKE